MAHGAVQCLFRATCRTHPGKTFSPQLMSYEFFHRSLNKELSSQWKMDHLDRTANNFRQQIISQAKVCRITTESETVKRVRFAVQNKDFTFKPGQWVDFFIPGISKVGGFSICSSPRLLQKDGVLELAVKYSTYPPAKWIHTQCTLDSEVELRVGGDFFFDPDLDSPPVNLLMIAGGVGINPLVSILLHVADLHRLHQSRVTEYEPGFVNLLYSAKNTDELLFKKTLLDLADKFPGKIDCSFHVTQQITPVCEYLRPYVTEGRISEQILAKHLSQDCLCYICGPPPMIESTSQQLENLGAPRDWIHFEKWW